MNKKRWTILIGLILVIFFAALFAGGKDVLRANRTVKFIDGYKHVTIEEKTVEVGGDVTPPEVPEYEGYVFIGWFDDSDNKITDFTNIKKSFVVTAKYGKDVNGNGILDSEDTYFEVVFYDTVKKEIIASERVLIGMSATEPKIPEHKGYKFDKWSTSFENVQKAIVVDAIYKKDKTTTTVKPKLQDKYTFKAVDATEVGSVQKIITIYKNNKLVSATNVYSSNNKELGAYSDLYKGIVVTNKYISDIAKAKLSNGTIVNIG